MADTRLPYDARQARAALGRLRADGERFSAKLRALDAHPGFRSLRDARRAGATLREFDRVSALTDECTGTLQAHLDDLDRAATILGVRGRVGRPELAELAAILDGPAEGVGAVDGGSAGGAVARMAAMDRAYDEVFAVVSDLERCATVVRQQVSRMDATLRELSARASELPFPDGDTASLLDGLRREWRAVAPAATADPKGCVDATGDGIADRLRRLADGIENARSDLATVSRQQAEVQASLAALRDRLPELATVEEQCRRAEVEAGTRITGAPPPDRPDTATDLRRALDNLGRRRATDGWRQIHEAVRDLQARLTTALDNTLARRGAALAQLEQRNELRGRLEAYRAMAIRFDHTEDLVLAAAFEQAHRILFGAPCDLIEATSAVSQYQRAVIERTRPDDAQTRGPHR